MLVLAQGIYDVCMLHGSDNCFLTPAYLALLYDHTCFCNLRMYIFTVSMCKSVLYETCKGSLHIHDIPSVFILSSVFCVL